MKFTPRNYQQIGIGHLLDTPRCALWAGMGMGKSATTLAGFDALYMAGAVERMLVLAPLRVAASTWPNEVEKWDDFAHLDVQPLIGTTAQRQAALRNDKAHIYTTNYEQLPWLVKQLGDSWPFDMVVADESTRLKGFRLRGQGTKRAAALGRVAHKKVTRFVELTGTPSPNGLGDLWGQSWFLDAGRRLGRTHGAFIERWFRPHWSGYGVEPMDHANDEIQERLQDVCLTLRPEDWFDLEAPIVNTLAVDLPTNARRLYDKMEREMFAELSETIELEAFNAAAKTNKCLQIANGAVYYDERGSWEEVHKAKLDALESVVEEAAGMPVLVAYQYKSDLARLAKHFGKRARVLDADPATEAAWNRGEIPILLAHPASAGHGLNLQHGGNVLAFFGLTWNLEHHDQMVERIGPVRQMQAGYQRPVYLHYIAGHGTLDDVVLERLRTKRDVQDLLLDAMRRRKE